MDYHRGKSEFYKFDKMLNLISNLVEVTSDINDEGFRSPKKVTVLGRLPGYFPGQGLKKSKSGEIYEEKSPYKYTIRANRFLEIQEGRIIKAIKEKNYTKAAFLGCLLLKNSYVYQTVLMNRVGPSGYYKHTMEEVRLFQMEVKRKLRKGDLKLTLERIYLDKGMEREGIPNGKYRPIGSPTIVSRLISKAFNDMIYGIYQGDFKGFQHGYRVGKGTHTALVDLGKRVHMEGHRTIYEFDFRSFFNSVSRSAIYNALARKSAVLGDIVGSLLRNIEYSFKELKPEAELIEKYEVVEEVRERTGEIKKSYKRLIVRNGLPQGLSVSPLLATLVLEDSGAPVENLIMYADDGLLIGDTVNKYFGLGRLSKMGVKINDEKTGQVGNEFKFLGTIWNIEERGIKFGESILKGTEEETKGNKVPTRISDGFKKVTSKYGKKPGEGNGDIKEDSWAMGYRSKLLNPKTRLMVMGYSAKNQSYLNFRYFMGKGIFHISALSSRCVNGLLERQKEDRYVYKLVDHFPKGMKKTENGKPSAFSIMVKVLRETNPNFLKQTKLVIKDKGRTRVKSCPSRNIIVNPELKGEGQLKGNRYKLLNRPKYFELVLPYSKKCTSDMILNNSRTDNNFMPKRTGLAGSNWLR